MKKRKLLSMVLAFALAFTLLPVSALTAMADTETHLDLGKSISAVSGSDNEWDITLDLCGDEVTQSASKYDIVLLVDVSGSMGDKINKNDSQNKLATVKEKTNAFINTVLNKATNGSVNFSVVTFSDEAKEVQSFTANKSQLNAAVNGMSADGGTNIQLGINKAKRVLQAGRSDAQKVIVLLGDGEPTYYSDIYEGGTVVPFQYTSWGSTRTYYKYVINGQDTLWFDHDPATASGGDCYYYTSYDDFKWNRNRTSYDKDVNCFYTTHGNGRNTTGVSQTIAEAQSAMNSGIDMYTIGFSINSDGAGVLGSCQNKGYMSANNAQELSDKFNDIADVVSNPFSNAVVTDTVSSNFELVGIVSINGTSYLDGSGNPVALVGNSSSDYIAKTDGSSNGLTWNLGTISTDSDNKDTLVYRIRIKDGATAGEHDTSLNNKGTVNYKYLDKGNVVEHFNQVQASVGIVTLKFMGSVIDLGGTAGTPSSISSDVTFYVADVSSFNASNYAYPATITSAGTEYSYKDFSDSSSNSYNRTVTYNYTYQTLPAQYTVDVTHVYGENDEVKETQATITEGDDNYSLTVETNHGDRTYTVSSVTVNGVEESSLLSGGTMTITGNTQIVVTYELVPAQYTVNVTHVYGENDEVKETQATVTEDNNSFTLNVVTTHDGNTYTVSSVTVNGVEDSSLLSGGTMTITGNTQIVVTYELVPAQYTVNVTHVYGENDEVKETQATVTEDNNSFTLNVVTTHDGNTYTVSSVTVNGVEDSSLLSGGTMTITGNTQIVVNYQLVIPETYTVTFMVNGSVFKEQNGISYGSAANDPGTPASYVDGDYTYYFSGWDKNFSEITGNLIVTAQFESELNENNFNVYHHYGNNPAEYDAEKSAFVSESDMINVSDLVKNKDGYTLDYITISGNGYEVITNQEQPLESELVPLTSQESETLSVEDVLALSGDMYAEVDLYYTANVEPTPEPTPEPEPEEAALIVKYMGTIYDTSGNVVSTETILTKRYVVHVDDVINGSDYIQDFSDEGYQYDGGDEATFTVDGKSTISFNYSKVEEAAENIEDESTPLAPIEDESTPLASAIPATGDSNSMLPMILLALASIGGAVGIVVKKKARKSN